MTELRGDGGELILYEAEDGSVAVDARLDQETVWLSQRQMAELFDKDVRTVNEHVKNIYFEEELEPEPTIRKFRMVQLEGNRQVSRHIDHYNLDVIISVGYRVRSRRGTQFRQWATRVLREPSHHREHREHRGNKPMILDLLCDLCVLCGEELFPATGTP